jgi:hypothetical protein
MKKTKLVRALLSQEDYCKVTIKWKAKPGTDSINKYIARIISAQLRMIEVSNGK